MIFKVTHFDTQGCRHCVRVAAPDNAAAMACAERLFGGARAMFCIWQRGL